MRPPLVQRLTAQRFRQELTLPEGLLWRQLKGRKIGGLQFRRQHPVGPYILDFYCEALRLAVESMANGIASIIDLAGTQSVTRG